MEIVLPISSFVIDTQDHPLIDENGNGVYDDDGDGVWDTGVVILGLKFDMESTKSEISRTDPKGVSEENPDGLIKDHEAFIAYAKRLIFEEQSDENCRLCNEDYNQLMTSSINTEIYSMCEKQNSNNPNSKCINVSTKLIENAKEAAESRPQRNPITLTGLTPVVHDVSDAIYDELVETMLPISGILVCITMMVLHRNPKVLIICGLPIAMSIAITFGITVIDDRTLTPMIISAGPILVGLGVDYSLHFTNRIEENRVELIEERLEKSWSMKRDGLGELEINPWDSSLSLTATVRAALTTGHAIFLSAVTTIIGFSVLTWTSLVPIEPMRTVGDTLLIGIGITFLLSMIMVPALVHLFRYRKNDTGLDMIRLPEPCVIEGDTFNYMFEDDNIVNGIEYTYSVVAYDMGVEPPYNTAYLDLGNGQFETVIDTNYSNPSKWADPDGYASLENSKGTTILDRNFIQVYPGVSPRTDLKDVKVVPNPYLSGSAYNESEHLRRIRFTNLTKACVIRIYTLTGELVSQIEHSDSQSGNAFWDLRTINNQEAGPGLYIYHVQSVEKNEGDPFIGKFAVVR